MKCVSNDYTNPTTNPKILMTLTLTLTNPHGLIKKFLSAISSRKTSMTILRVLTWFYSKAFVQFYSSISFPSCCIISDGQNSLPENSFLFLNRRYYFIFYFQNTFEKYFVKVFSE